MRAVLILLPAILMAQAPVHQHPPVRPKPKPAAVPQPTSDDEKTIYSLGLSIYRSLEPFDLSQDELKLVQRGISDAAAGKPAVDLNTWGPKIRALANSRRGLMVQREKEASAAYLTRVAVEPGAIKTASGLIYREIRPGTGPSPKATDKVRVNYRGTLINGTEFDSSYQRKQPAEFALNQVIRCWTEGVQRMKVGGKSVLVCPSDLAYGDAGRPSIPGGATLIFEIELLGIVGNTP